jgi:hypothetical protein
VRRSRKFSSQLGWAPSRLPIAGVLEAIDATHILDRPLVNTIGIRGNYDIELTAPAEVPENSRPLVIDHLERIPAEN